MHVLVLDVTESERKEFIDIDIPLDADPGLLHNNSYSGSLQFQFDRIFGTRSSQEEIFNSVAKPKVNGIFDGVNGTVFAYGQTGSG